MNFEANSILWIAASVNGEKIVYINNNLSRTVDDININPQDFIAIARERYQIDLSNLHEMRMRQLKVLAEMEQRNKLISVITQNIDGLHQRAGSKKVWEIHGTTLENFCRKCGKKHPADFIFKSEEDIPHCECGGTVRPNVVLYGESLPSFAHNEAYTDLAEADLIIVGGTSLQVYPAANYIQEQVRFKKVVLINREETDIDDECEIVFHENLGDVFSRIVF
jgi:NAD-dependent deacetylase